MRQNVASCYDVQHLRIGMGNRLVSHFFRKLGQTPSESPDDIDDAEAQKMLNQLRTIYEKVTDGVKNELPSRGKFKGEGMLTDYGELVLLHGYMSLERDEKAMFGRLKPLLADIELYRRFLAFVPGCGPAMSSIIICYFDPSKARHVSSYWKYAGLDVVSVERNGESLSEGRGRKSEHLVDRNYTDRDGKSATRKSLTFNPLVKTKMVEVMSGCFLRVGNNPYVDIYRDYKNRLANHPKWVDKRPAHRDRAAKRYMVKMFLKDLWLASRKLEGLPTPVSYAQAKLGLQDHPPLFQLDGPLNPLPAHRRAAK